MELAEQVITMLFVLGIIAVFIMAPIMGWESETVLLNLLLFVAWLTSFTEGGKMLVTMTCIFWCYLLYTLIYFAIEANGWRWLLTGGWIRDRRSQRVRNLRF